MLKAAGGADGVRRPSALKCGFILQRGGRRTTGGVNRGSWTNTLAAYWERVFFKCIFIS